MIKAGSLILLAVVSIGVWGIAIFLLLSNENSVPGENHTSNQVYRVDKEKIIYKNKLDIAQSKETGNLKSIRKKLKNSRVSIDELLTAITKEK